MFQLAEAVCFSWQRLCVSADGCLCFSSVRCCAAGGRCSRSWASRWSRRPARPSTGITCCRMEHRTRARCTQPARWRSDTSGVRISAATLSSDTRQIFRSSLKKARQQKGQSTYHRHSHDSEKIYVGAIAISWPSASHIKGITRLFFQNF